MDRSLHVIFGFCLHATINSWSQQAFPIWQLASLEPGIQSVSNTTLIVMSVWSHKWILIICSIYYWLETSCVFYILKGRQWDRARPWGCRGFWLLCNTLSNSSVNFLATSPTSPYIIGGCVADSSNKANSSIKALQYSNKAIPFVEQKTTLRLWSGISGISKLFTEPE